MICGVGVAFPSLLRPVDDFVFSGTRLLGAVGLGSESLGNGFRLG